MKKEVIKYGKDLIMPHKYDSLQLTQNSGEVNILSIDFDFFQDVDPDTLNFCYPDGVDLSTKLSEIVWSSHYVGRCKEQLMKVGIRKEMFDEVKRIVFCNADDDTIFAVANSHVHMYDFVGVVRKAKNPEQINIYNLDMHHDCFNKNNVLDCGNWVKYVRRDYKNCKVSWIANPVSKEMYGMTEKKRWDDIKTDLDEIKNKHIDAIFLCRSDAWTPPHLDNYFDELLRCFSDMFHNGMIQECIQHPRDISGYVTREAEFFKE